MESKNVPAMTAALAAYVGDAELRRRHGRAARARAESKFSLDRMAAQYAALYRSVVNGTRGLQDNKEHSA